MAPETRPAPGTPTLASVPQPNLLDAAPLAYENLDFLESSDGRAIRILSEYQEPMARFRRERIEDTVVFFGSARFRARDVATANLEIVEKPGSRTLALADEQPALPLRHLDQSVTASRTMERSPRLPPSPSATTPPVDHEPAHTATTTQLQLAQAAVDMARFYEDARTLARMLATWARSLPGRRHRFVVTSGGGPGIMEAANRGAHEAGAKTIGLNIVLPFEQQPNPWITPALSFNFHYFFMRKFWFAYLAKALVVFPGGFGTLDEMFELLTLAQTSKLAKPMTVIIYGSSYWKTVINFDALLEHGAIARADLDLFRFADTPEEAFRILQQELTRNHLLPRPSPIADRDPAHPQSDPLATSTHPPESIPPEPAASAQQVLGPDIARTR